MELFWNVLEIVFQNYTINSYYVFNFFSCIFLRNLNEEIFIFENYVNAYMIICKIYNE